MSERDYYEVLGLRFDADGTSVNRTYWLLARKYQALATSDPRAHQMLDELNEAYGVLGTPTLREAYDAAHPELANDQPAAHRDWDGADVQTAAAFTVRRAASASRRPALNVNAAAPYVGAVVLGVIGAGAGLIAGSFLLAGLGASGALLLAAAYARHKMNIGPSQRPIRDARLVEASPAPALEPRVANDQSPLSTSIVRRRGMSADELRLSTASMVGRWRSAAVVTHDGAGADVALRPDPTLVDIFRSEEEVERSAEPLSAVLDVLRGSRTV